jgi:serine/threonine protein kinase
VKVSHFSLARRLDRKELLSYNTAPEVLRRQPCGQKGDVFSAGTILYEMLYGCVPFKARDQQSLLDAIDKGPLQNTSSGVSQGTQELLKEMLTPKPEDRIELLDVLDIVAGFEAEGQARRLE